MAKFTIWQIVLLTPGYIFASGFKPVRTLAIGTQKDLFPDTGMLTGDQARFQATSRCANQRNVLAAMVLLL